MKKLLLAAVTLLLAVNSVSADFLYTINDPNAALSPYPAPYGTVKVTLDDATHATINLTAASTGGFNYIFFDGSTLALNTNGTVALSSTITGTQPADAFFKGEGPFSLGGAGSVSEFGDFNFTVNTFDGPKNGVNSLTFQLENTSGVWASDKTVLTANADGYSVAGHVGVFTNDYGIGAVQTGFAGNGSNPPPPPPPPPPAVPEPATFAMALFGLASLGAYRLKRRKIVA